MFKGFGYFALFVFILLATQMATAGIFISILFVIAGVIAFAGMQFPSELEDEKLTPLLEHDQKKIVHLMKEIEELATIIRRDGLLVAEVHRKNLKDHKLQYLIKRSMDGFEKKHLLSWIENHAASQKDSFEYLQKYFDRVLALIPVVGLVGSIFQLMHQPIVLETAFLPFLISLFLQLLLQTYYQEKIDLAHRHSALYFAILAEGMSGIADGLNADFIFEQLVARIGERVHKVEK